MYGMTQPCSCSTVVCGQSTSSKGKKTSKTNIHHCKTPLDHAPDHHAHCSMTIPSFGMFSCDIAEIAPVMLNVKVVWLTCEHGTEMGTPLPVLNKHRKLSPVSGERIPELIVRVI